VSLPHTCVTANVIAAASGRASSATRAYGCAGGNASTAARIRTSSTPASRNSPNVRRRFGIELPVRQSLAGSGEDVILGGILNRFERRLNVSQRLDAAASVDDVIRHLMRGLPPS